MSDEHLERLVKLESSYNAIMSLLALQSEAQKETRDELRQFRTGLFDLINPLVHDLGKTRGQLEVVKNDMAWVKKSRSWAPAIGLGGAGGLATLIWNFVKSLWEEGG